MNSIWLGVLAAMLVLAVPAGWLTRKIFRGVAVLREIGPLLDEACRRSLAADIARIPAGAASRWQHCDWCDPAGNSARTAEECRCVIPCQQPSGLWCTTPYRRVGASIAALGHSDALAIVCPPCNGTPGRCTCAGLCGHPACIGDHTVLHDMAAELEAILRQGER